MQKPEAISFLKEPLSRLWIKEIKLDTELKHRSVFTIDLQRVQDRNEQYGEQNGIGVCDNT